MPRRRMKLRWAFALALALAVGAGASASAKPIHRLTKTQVKKLAAKVVAQRAPTLSVAHATTADTLAGATAATLQDRIASGSNNTGSPASLGVSEILPAVTITVPSGVSFLRITGTSDFTGTGNISIFVAPSGIACGSTANDAALRPYLTLNNSRGQLTTDTVVPVSPGPQAFHLCAGIDGGPVQLYPRTLVLETVAGGSTGIATP